FHDRSCTAPVSEFRQFFDEGTQFEWAPYGGDEYSGIPEREYRTIMPLIYFRGVMWHRPDRVLRQFGMEQLIPHTDMLEGEVMVLLGLTQRWEVGMRETMQQYVGQWEMRDDHVAETGLVRDPERWHFHD
ncbi:Serine/threonine-protein phosphatase 7 long form homolog, partial [Linum grandiflorum]